MSTNLRLHLVTWNVGESQPPQDFTDLLGLDKKELPDLYVIGLQELLSDTTTLFTDSIFDDPWSNAIIAALGQRDYVRIKSLRLVGIHLSVYIRRSLLFMISDVECEFTRTGFGGLWGSKGGVSVKFGIYGVNLCLINSHFSAHDENFAQRIEDYNQVLLTQKFKDADCPSILDSDYVFWLGDLNFRLNDVPNEEVRKRVDEGNYQQLLDHDQLNNAKKDNLIFLNFEEGQISFPPTYKFDVDTDCYDTSYKNRVPAWCDRILWRVHEDAFRGTTLGVQQHLYTSLACYKNSDHRPVVASFTVKVLESVPISPVMFEPLSSWTRGKDQRVVYTISKKFLSSTRDWIGVFPANHRNLEDYATYVWVPTRGEDNGDGTYLLTAVFEERDLARLPSGRYKLLYMSVVKNYVVGYSNEVELLDSDRGTSSEEEEEEEPEVQSRETNVDEPVPVPPVASDAALPPLPPHPRVSVPSLAILAQEKESKSNFPIPMEEVRAYGMSLEAPTLKAQELGDAKEEEKLESDAAREVEWNTNESNKLLSLSGDEVIPVLSPTEWAEAALNNRARSKEDDKRAGGEPPVWVREGEDPKRAAAKLDFEYAKMKASLTPRSQEEDEKLTPLKVDQRTPEKLDLCTQEIVDSLECPVERYAGFEQDLHSLEICGEEEVFNYDGSSQKCQKKESLDGSMAIQIDETPAYVCRADTTCKESEKDCKSIEDEAIASTMGLLQIEERECKTVSADDLQAEKQSEIIQDVAQESKNLESSVGREMGIACVPPSDKETREESCDPSTPSDLVLTDGVTDSDFGSDLEIAKKDSGGSSSVTQSSSSDFEIIAPPTRHSTLESFEDSYLAVREGAIFADDENSEKVALQSALSAGSVEKDPEMIRSINEQLLEQNFSDLTESIDGMDEVPSVLDGAKVKVELETKSSGADDKNNDEMKSEEECVVVREAVVYEPDVSSKEIDPTPEAVADSKQEPVAKDAERSNRAPEGLVERYVNEVVDTAVKEAVTSCADLTEESTGGEAPVRPATDCAAHEEGAGSEEQIEECVTVETRQLDLEKVGPADSPSLQAETRVQGDVAGEHGEPTPDGCQEKEQKAECDSDQDLLDVLSSKDFVMQPTPPQSPGVSESIVADIPSESSEGEPPSQAAGDNEGGSNFTDAYMDLREKSLQDGKTKGESASTELTGPVEREVLEALDGDLIEKNLSDLSDVMGLKGDEVEEKKEAEADGSYVPRSEFQLLVDESIAESARPEKSGVVESEVGKKESASDLPATLPSEDSEQPLGVEEGGEGAPHEASTIFQASADPSLEKTELYQKSMDVKEEIHEAIDNN